ncbi:hypothetical protein JCGZ_05218 [Jatropha curcas]|uniref:Uncharacterized protein n=1 Tax=Jatropha curcas TaxID=180498 RepID=A0A067KRZ6_JATCU|nr:hypothetical protein JCGZ_05218 [Jatropha curcas]
MLQVMKGSSLLFKKWGKIIRYPQNADVVRLEPSGQAVMMNCEAVWILFSIRDDALRSGSSQFFFLLMMVDYEVDQGNQIKILRANQIELWRCLQNQSDRVLEIITDPTGANKADQTELWT